MHPHRRVANLARTITAVAIVVAAAGAPAQGAQARQASPAGRWAGAITLPSAELKIVVSLDERAGAWSGTIDIPAQNISAMAIGDVRIAGFDVAFVLPAVPGSPAFKGTLSADGATIAGNFTQAGQAFPFQLKRSEAPGAATAAALAGLDAFIADAMKSWNVPGLALAIVKDGEVVLKKGYGVRNVKAGTPVTADTVFAIGSSSKAFTTMALAALVDEGKLSWDEPVRTYLPDFKMADAFATERMTPRDLVTHRSGLPRHDLVWYNAKASRAELVERVRFLQPNADLRTKFQYQNLMFLTAGYLAGRVAGTSWEDVVATRIFRPLEMTRSNFSVIESQKAHEFALPYALKNKAVQEIPFRDITTVGPAGSINSTVTDMSNWVRLHLGRGKLGPRQVIAARQIDAMYQPQMVIDMPALAADPEIQQPSYGMGWFVESYRGRKHVHHGGNIDGFAALVSLMPAENFGVVILTNMNATALPTIVARHISDRLLGLPPIDWNGRYLKRREVAEKAGESAKKAAGEDRVTGTTPAHPLVQYAGEYDHPAYGALAIASDTDGFRVTFHDIPMRLRHWHYETFRGEVEDTAFAEAKLFFQFGANQQGEIDRVSVALEPLVDAIVFTKRPPARLTDAGFLKGLAGVYIMADNAEFRMTVTLTGSVVTLTIPGQEPRTLEPAYGTTFKLKGLTGVTVKFELDAQDRATLIKLSQPNGVYTLKRAAPSS